MLIENRSILAEGNSTVCICTRPPENSPGMSGVYVFNTLILSINSAGKRSSGTTRFSGSVVGTIELLSIVAL